MVSVLRGLQVIENKKEKEVLFIRENMDHHVNIKTKVKGSPNGLPYSDPGVFWTSTRATNETTRERQLSTSLS